MATLTLSSLNKTFPDGTVAVRDFSLDVDDAEFVVIVGASGCGKSTALRMIAGLEHPTSGTVAIGDRVVNDVHPKDRDIAMVFQNYALYPHMSVYKNMAFGLQMRRVPKGEIDRRVRATAELLGIGDLLNRKPRALSGGQRQRVAVGRAIVREPVCFLFDEPLSNLDARLRVSTRAEIKALHQRLRTTTVYVTHDQEEALTLGDRVVVMADGAIQQAGTPLDVYRAPANRFVAGFVGTPAMNFFPGTLTPSTGGDTPHRFEPRPEHADADQPGAEPVWITARPDAVHPGRRAALGERADAVLGLRPTVFRVVPDADARPADLRLRVEVREPLGEQVDLRGHARGWGPMIVRVGVHDLERGLPEIGSEVALRVDRDTTHLFAPGPMGVNLATDPANDPRQRPSPEPAGSAASPGAP